MIYLRWPDYKLFKGHTFSYLLTMWAQRQWATNSVQSRKLPTDCICQTKEMLQEIKYKTEPSNVWMIVKPTKTRPFQTYQGNFQIWFEGIRHNNFAYLIWKIGAAAFKTVLWWKSHCVARDAESAGAEGAFTEFYIQQKG